MGRCPVRVPVRPVPGQRHPAEGICGYLTTPNQEEVTDRTVSGAGSTMTNIHHNEGAQIVTTSPNESAKAARSPQILRPCPTWCTLPRDHGMDPVAEDFDPEGRIHRAPLFGRVLVDCDDLEGFSYAVDGHDLMPQSIDSARGTTLRQLAGGLLNAADWLDAHTEGEPSNHVPTVPESRGQIEGIKCPAWCKHPEGHEPELENEDGRDVWVHSSQTFTLRDFDVQGSALSLDDGELFDQTVGIYSPDPNELALQIPIKLASSIALAISAAALSTSPQDGAR